MSDRGAEIFRQFEDMRSNRSNWEDLWQDIREYVRPNTDDFYRYTTKGRSQVNKIYDGTALWALDQLAAGLNGHLTSPTSRWFEFSISGRVQLSEEEMAYLEAVADRVYVEYNRSEVNFAPTIHECYLDIGAMGTSVMFQDWDGEGQHVRFNNFPLAECFIRENQNGFVDTMGRMKKMNPSQLRKKFGEKNLPTEVTDCIRSGKMEREFEVVHVVFPRVDRDIFSTSKLNKPFASVWILTETKDILQEGGFDSFPYHVPRWQKLSGETYGRSPAMTCLPDIRLVNQMKKTIIKAAQKATDPPIQVESDGFMLPIRTSPGSLIFRQSGAAPAEPLIGGDPRIGFDFIQDPQDRIMKSFYVDWLIRNKKKERQSVMEIADDRDEMLRQMAPMLGRLQVELLGPMLGRTMDLMARHDMLPDPPDSLVGQNIDIGYISPAAMAQFGGKAVSIQRYVQDLAQVASVAPEVLDKVDFDALADQMAKYGNVSRTVLRDAQQVAARRQQRAQQEAQQQQLEAGQQVASAMKDASTADKNFRS